MNITIEQINEALKLKKEYKDTQKLYNKAHEVIEKQITKDIIIDYITTCGIYLDGDERRITNAKEFVEKWEWHLNSITEEHLKLWGEEKYGCSCCSRDETSLDIPVKFFVDEHYRTIKKTEFDKKQQELKKKKEEKKKAMKIAEDYAERQQFEQLKKKFEK